jgi:site-specific DNA recombinase
MIPAAEYYRMSDDSQETSIPSQQAAVRPFAKSGGYKIVATYEDHGISGDDTARRKGFQRMIADAKAGKFKAILCWDQDRFGRFDSLEAGYWIHPLRLAGVALVTVTDGLVNWDDFTGRIMYSLKQETKHQYLRDLSQNVTRGMLDKARAGLWTSGRPPLGYILGDDQRLKLGPPDAIAAVRFIFEGYLAGHSLRTLTEQVNFKGYHTLTGGEFCYMAVRTILRNPNYTGDMYWNLRCFSKYNRPARLEKRIFRPQDEWICTPNAHPAIVTREEFAAVAAKIIQKRTATTPHPCGGPYVLTGLIWCAACGGRMAGSKWNNGQGDLQYYVCCNYFHRGKSYCDRNAVRQEVLVGAVVEAITDEFLEPKAVKRLREAVRRKAAASIKRPDNPQLPAQLAKVRKELATAERNMALAGSDELRRRYESVVTGLASKEEALAAALREAQQPKSVVLASADARVDAALAKIASLRTASLAGERMRLREALREAVARIDVKVRYEERTKRRRYYLESGEIHMRPLNLLAADPYCKQVLTFKAKGKAG